LGKQCCLVGPLDAEKLCEDVSLSQVIDDAMDLRAPPADVVMAVAIALLPRFIAKRHWSSPWIPPSASIVAGGPAATYLVEAYLYKVIRRTIARRPVKPRQRADDLHVFLGPLTCDCVYFLCGGNG
jgi:hypothetical protein